MTGDSLNIRDYLSFGRNEHSICFAIKTVACKSGVMTKNGKTGPKAATLERSDLMRGGGHVVCEQIALLEHHLGEKRCKLSALIRNARLCGSAC